MRKIGFTAAAVLVVLTTAFVATAQTPTAAPAPAAAPAPGTLVKSDETKVLPTADIMEAARKGRATNTTDIMVSSNLITQLPYRLNVEHRIAGTTPPSIHERNGELFYVVDGDGILTTGGRLVDPVRRNATNIAGTAIADGQSRAVHKGDMMFVPAGTPHQVADVKNTLTMVIIMLPNPTP